MVLICHTPPYVSYLHTLKFQKAPVYPFTGSCLLASLNIGRNVVAVEKDRWQFLHSQMRAVNSLSDSSTETAETSETFELPDTNEPTMEPGNTE